MLRSSLVVVTALLPLSGCNFFATPAQEDAGVVLPIVENPWEPGQSRRVYSTPNSRGLVEKKGLIHAHSYYSHDACDGKPVDENGVPNQKCYEDFREGVCKTQQDFVMLTDHGGLFNETEYPDALLYKASLGDHLVQRNNKDVANFLGCGDEQDPTLILAGSESSAFMFLGLEGHAAPIGERSTIYGERTDEAAAALRDNGALIWVSHTENYTVDELIELPLDGFEMFNMHANTLQNVSVILDMMLRLQDDGNEGFPQSDLTLLRIYTEDPRYLDTWSKVLARGVKRVTTMGSDCHRNAFPGLLPDGERMDSYRRMMSWFTNHLLIRPEDDGSFDDTHLKSALKGGRLFGVFEALGQVEGFDYVAKSGENSFEMGEEAVLSAGVTLKMALPQVMDLPNDVEKPEVTLRILRATDQGWVEVASSIDAPLSFEVSQAGAYRAEVRLLPYHLQEFLGDDDIYVMRESRIWVYSNAIYVQ